MLGSQMFFSICEKHIEEARVHLQNTERKEGEDKTLLELFSGTFISVGDRKCLSNAF